MTTLKLRPQSVQHPHRSAQHPFLRKRHLLGGLCLSLFIGAVVLAPLWSERAIAQQAVAIDADDIGGVVTGPSGPEAGVWVIAETRDLLTRFIRVVVTDDQGRYVVPDLPKGTYDLWVRGYGLVDSPKVKSEPGKLVNHTASAAPNAATAILVCSPTPNSTRNSGNMAEAGVERKKSIANSMPS